MSDRDSHMMMQAIDLARRAEGRTSPNPMVGCVLAHGDEIVGRGWHKGPGTPHAEVMALTDAGDRAAGATAFVTLEPCNHFGTTPPCAGALIRAGVTRVVYGVSDKNPVAAGGAMALRAASIAAEQIGGEARRAAEDLIAPWAFFIKTNRPHVTLKWASTLDGRVATRTGQSKWITGPAARAAAHELRQRSDAVLVGIGTVLADDPALDPRPPEREPAPIRKVILDSDLQCPPTAKALTSPGDVTIFCREGADADRAAVLRDAGADVCQVARHDNGLDLAAILSALGARGIVSAMVEGGGTVLGSFADQGLFEEVWAFLAPAIMGGGKAAVDGEGLAALDELKRLSVFRVEQVGDDILVRCRTKKEEA
ncbi:MAG: bifunctional diaminohydroxyphosphoribosylaminopyrimidine deaminase/5-amino-6-(5-phosphoribosylamino)uracil reductase RibD [Parvularcula sp.]